MPFCRESGLIRETVRLLSKTLDRVFRGICNTFMSFLIFVLNFKKFKPNNITSNAEHTVSVFLSQSQVHFSSALNSLSLLATTHVKMLSFNLLSRNFHSLKGDPIPYLALWTWTIIFIILVNPKPSMDTRGLIRPKLFT